MRIAESYLISSLASLVMFGPWIVVFVNHSSQAEEQVNWTQLKGLTIIDFLKIWTRNLSRAFFDTGQSSHSGQLLLLYVLIYLAIVTLVGYSIYFLCRHTSQKIWLFILTLMGVTALALVLPDLVLGGQRTIRPRYFLPSYLGIQLAISYLISSKLTAISSKPLQQKLWQFIAIAIFSCGVVSSAIYSQSQIWWNKNWNIGNPVVSQIINQANKPLSR